MALILTAVVVFILIMLSEFWWRKHPQPNELSRKFVHITVGSFVAFWPYFLSWTQIIILSVAFLVVVGASKYFRIFKAIHSVQRPTWGELFFALAVGIIAIVTDTKEIYTVALLQMSLADGLAAIVGLRFGTGTRYKVFGSTKSIAGTATFFIVSFSLLVVFASVTDSYAPLGYLVALAAVTSLIENLGVFGLDNLMVPLVVALVLSH
ncbi:SEC59/DGK1/VTE5 family protein [soil metagenome]